MKRSAMLAFSEMDVDIEFEDSHSPSTVRAIITALPVEMTAEI